MTKRQICAVTSSRADYNLLAPPMRLIRDDPSLELQVIVTGMHLTTEFGFTYRRIEQEGFPVTARVESSQRGDDVASVTKSIGYGVIGFADVLQRLRPDILMILGDRYEIFAAAQAAVIARVPIAHLCGGDTVDGAFDDGIRHAITKMAHLHFVTNEMAARRLRQMGENPDHVYLVGNPGLDQIRQVKRMPREDTFAALGIPARARNLLIAFHPETLAMEGSLTRLEELLAALSELGPDHSLIFTGPNSDSEGRSFARRMEAFVGEHENAILRTSLGQTLYLNALAHCDAVVGNSSSGIYEAPSLKTATVNIGNRQNVRLKADSVIDCAAERAEIARAIIRAIALDCSRVENPYGEGHSAPLIVEALKALPDPTALLKKHFYEIKVA
jgi:UDP-N-acetylglucosamine 2-epimerase (non-hydrolysing)/GDP/UDP-N,N'-diacetylbacillosamine 2-epimerase (hydrolysing)